MNPARSTRRGSAGSRTSGQGWRKRERRRAGLAADERAGDKRRMRILALLLAAAALQAQAAPAAPEEQAAATAAAARAADSVAESIEATVAQIEGEAFMLAYAAELSAGDRAAIAARYDRRGAWRLGNGAKSFEPWPAIRDFYAGPHWQPPASFEWRELSFEPAGPDSIVVAGLFRWGAAGGAEPRTYTYTALLVRQDGELRIRLEDESGAPQR